jgi:uracil-DNA glycosylase
MIVGDFLSNKDEDAGGPFRDGLGKMFKSFLHQSGISPRECFFTNVFLRTPPGRFSPDSFCGPRVEGIPNMKPLRRGKYIRKEFFTEVSRLWAQVNEYQPNLILAAGDLALWALGEGDNSMATSRGRIAAGNAAIYGRKILPTHSPSQVAADWPLRPIVLADLEKARREQCFPDIRRPQRYIHVKPTLDDMQSFLEEYIHPSPTLDCDIETVGPIITCVGFAPTPDRALVIPFYSETAPDRNYWSTKAEEVAAWRFVDHVLSLGKRVGGQNYQYDMQYLYREMGIGNPCFTDDTMLLHHVLQPELRKGLGFLASVYTDEIKWKGMHKTPASKSAKRGDD